MSVWAPPGTYKVTLPEAGGMLMEPYTEPCKPEPPDPEPPEPGPEPPHPPNPEPPPGDALDLRAYGAVGDGAADDTDAVQRACDDSAAGKGTVIGHSGDVYLLRHRGTKPFLNIQSRFCVQLRSGTKINGMGCEFKLGGNENAYCFTNADQDNGTRDVTITDCEINGHRREQFSGKGQKPPDNQQEHGGIGVYNVERWTLERIHFWNISMYATRMWHSRHCTFRDLSGQGSNGDMFSFGQDAIGMGPKVCRNSLIENVFATDCEQKVSNKQGNPLIGSLVDCTVKGTVGGTNCAGGIKIQGTSKGSTFEKCRFTGGKVKTANSGTKLQGNQNSTNPSSWVQDLVVEDVESDDCAAEGLRFSHALRCRVKLYTGRNCGQLSGQPEVLFREVCHDCRVDVIHSTSAHGYVVECRKDDVVNPSVGKLTSLGCDTDVVHNASKKAVLVIDEMICRQTVGKHAHARNGGKIRIKHLKADRAMDTTGDVQVETFTLLG